jgi:acetyl esterase/lipase
MLALNGEYLAKVGLSRADICGVAGLAGPYDFMPRQEDLEVFGLSQRKKEDRFEPIAFVDGKGPPMLLLQGTADDVVFPDNATNLAARIEQAGGSVQLVEYKGRGHVGILLALAWPFRWMDPVRRDVVAYFRERAAVVAKHGAASRPPDAAGEAGRSDK